MAVQLCSENSGILMSPRISFSHDLSQSDVVPVEQPLFRSNSSPGVDFNFCIRESYDEESSPADELFSDGKILPTDQIKKKTAMPPPPKQTDHQPELGTKATSCGSGLEKQNSKSSFWRPFNRSSSLNCGSGYARSLCPLPILSRSNSAGSTTSAAAKRSSSLSPKDNHHTHKQNSLKNSSIAFFPKSPQPSSSDNNHQKPPLKKSYGSYNYGNGVRVNPVLNVPSANLFGLGFIFFNGKDKNKKK